MPARSTPLLFALATLTTTLAGLGAARADQCAWIAPEVAARAVAELRAQRAVAEHCEPCGDTSARLDKVDTVDVADKGHGLVEVRLNGRGLDLAYTFVEGPDRAFHNLAKLAGCPTRRVSATLPAGVDRSRTPPGGAPVGPPQLTIRAMATAFSGTGMMGSSRGQLDRALTSGPGATCAASVPRGRSLLVVLDVDAAGAVTDADVRGLDPTDATVDACLRAALTTLRLPRSPRGGSLAAQLEVTTSRRPPPRPPIRRP